MTWGDRQTNIQTDKTVSPVLWMTVAWIHRQTDGGTHRQTDGHTDTNRHEIVNNQRDKDSTFSRWTHGWVFFSNRIPQSVQRG